MLQFLQTILGGDEDFGGGHLKPFGLLLESVHHLRFDYSYFDIVLYFVIPMEMTQKIDKNIIS